MSSKKEKQILKKIQILITRNFNDAEQAFNYFDKSGDGELDKNEVNTLLKEAEVSGFIRSIVAGKLMEKFDETKNETIGWKEFKHAVRDIL